MNRAPIDCIRDILVHEFSDMDEERINIYNEKFKIPPKDGAFITIEYKGSPKIISSRNYMEGTDEVQELNTSESFVVGIFSKNLEALQQKEKVVMALNSIFSVQTQEKYSFKIYREMKIEDLSFLEASAMLRRFDITFTVNAWYKETKAAEYFETFSTKVQVDPTDFVEEFDQAADEAPY